MTPKICFIVTDAISFNFLCHGQLEYFKRNSDFEIHLICGGCAEEFFELSSRNVGVVHNVNLVRRPSLFTDLRAVFQIYKIIRKNKYDLVVYSTPKALLLSSISSYLAGTPIRIALFRGRAYENFTGIKRKIYTLFDRLCCKLSSFNIFISKSLRSAYIAEGITTTDNSLIIGSGSSNGVDTIRFAPVENLESPIVSSFEIPYKKKLICLVVGRFCLDKGSKELEKIVLQTNSAVHFVIVGDPEDIESESILKRLLKLESKVTHVPKARDTSDFFKVADLHIFLSHREGFGNVALEAASTNVPTLAYDVVGVRDSVKNGITGTLFQLGDIDSISNTINYYQNNLKKLKIDFPHIRNYAISNFEQNLVWKSQLNFYNSIIKTNNEACN